MNHHDKGSKDWGLRLADRRVDRACNGMLFVNGWPEQELDEGLCEVRVRAVSRFARGTKPPETVGEMTAFCTKIAKDLAIDRLRKKAVEDRYCVGLCEDPDAYTTLEYGVAPQHDSVDAARLLEIAAELFRRGEMPEHGVDILEGIASGCTYKEVATDLGITHRAVQGRLKTMRKLFRQEIEQRGIETGEDR